MSFDVIKYDKIICSCIIFKYVFYVVGGGHVVGVQTIMSARVPIIKFIDCGTGIECDLSVENRDGIQKSRILHIVSGIDERFQKLSFLVIEIYVHF